MGRWYGLMLLAEVVGRLDGEGSETDGPVLADRFGEEVEVEPHVPVLDDDGVEDATECSSGTEAPTAATWRGGGPAKSRLARAV